MAAQKQETPPRRGFLRSPLARASVRRIRRSLLGAGTDDLDLDAAVLRLAFLGLVVGHGLLLALAFGVHAVLLDALARQVVLDGVGTAHRELLVERVAAVAVGVA